MQNSKIKVKRKKDKLNFEENGLDFIVTLTVLLLIGSGFLLIKNPEGKETPVTIEKNEEE